MLPSQLGIVSVQCKAGETRTQYSSKRLRVVLFYRLVRIHANSSLQYFLLSYCHQWISFDAFFLASLGYSLSRIVFDSAVIVLTVYHCLKMKREYLFMRMSLFCLIFRNIALRFRPYLTATDPPIRNKDACTMRRLKFRSLTEGHP